MALQRIQVNLSSMQEISKAYRAIEGLLTSVDARFWIMPLWYKSSQQLGLSVVCHAITFSFIKLQYEITGSRSIIECQIRLWLYLHSSSIAITKHVDFVESLSAFVMNPLVSSEAIGFRTRLAQAPNNTLWNHLATLLHESFALQNSINANSS